MAAVLWYTVDMDTYYNSILIASLALGLFGTFVLGTLISNMIKALVDIGRCLLEAMRVAMVSVTIFTTVLLACWGLLDALSRLP